MSCLKAGIPVYGSSDFPFKKRGSFRVRSSIQSLQSNPKEWFLLDEKPVGNLIIESPKLEPVSGNEETLRWWEKWLQPNMIEIESPQQLVDSLVNAGERLAVVDFYSPDCGGCRTLHPKVHLLASFLDYICLLMLMPNLEQICQLAEKNSDAIFLQVNYRLHKEMCGALNIHVLPFFRFYRGPEGKACSFSCTNATIKKFKDAMAKYGSPSRCLGSAKGLDESELSALASRSLISR